MKKVGIITFHRADNYGAVLQNYALQKAIEQWCNVETVDYRCDFLEKPYSKPPFSEKNSNQIKNVINRIRYTVSLNVFYRLRNGFDEFRKMYLKISKPYNQSDLFDRADDFDIYITGSDQVWNDNITNGDRVYSLGFDTKAKKVAYAASSGSIQMIGKQTLSNIRKLDCISVREKDLQEYLLDVTQKNILLVVDPVFLLSKKEWDNILTKPKNKERFIFTYSVSEMTEEVVNVAKYIASRENLKIYHMDHSLRYGIKGIRKYGASPIEFLEYIRDAEVVIASSFHAVAFSIIFGKKFIVIPTPKTASRIENLLKLVNAEENMFTSYEDYVSQNRSLKVPDMRMMECDIEQSLAFLEDIVK